MAAGRNKKRRVFKVRRTRPIMARRRRYGRVRRVYARARSYGGRARGGIRSIGTGIRPYAAGIGGGAIGEAIAVRVAPQAMPIASYGGAFIMGGVKGLIGKVAFDVISGRGGLVSLFGGGATSTTEVL
jgi:hypothetical protein